MHRAVVRKDAPQPAKTSVRVGEMVKHAGADNLVELLA
jgi:hypothetical protein